MFSQRGRFLPLVSLLHVLFPASFSFSSFASNRPERLDAGVDSSFSAALRAGTADGELRRLKHDAGLRKELLHR
jgi:hypothetical protein